MTRAHDHASHPAPHRGRVETYEALFSVCGAPLAWIVQLGASFALSSSACFRGGDRLFAHPGVQAWPLAISVACLLVALASLWLGLVLLRRTRNEEPGGKHELLERGQGRTRFLAIWGIGFAAVFSLLIAVNILLLLGLPVCER